MRLSRLLLITSFLSAAQVHALPALSDTNTVSERILGRNLFDIITAWFGFGGDDARVVNLGRMECESDPGWRKTGWCAKVGKSFPKDGGMTPNPMDPKGLPAIPNYRETDWELPNSGPKDLGPFKPVSAPEPAPHPGDVTVPNGPLDGERANGPNGGGRAAPGGPGEPRPRGVDYVLPDGSVYKSPPGLHSAWTSADRMAFYNRVCITDALGAVTEGAPPQAALLDEAGLETCDEVEGELYDEIDEMDEAREMAEAATKPINGDMEYSDNGGYSPSEIDHWQDHPEFGNPGYSPEDMMMSGGLGAGSVAASTNTMDFINGHPRWKRSYRRMARKLRQWIRRKNANGFFDPESTKGINYAFGLENDPILRGPGPDDDPTIPRLTAEEKMLAGIHSIASMPFVPLILPDNHTWIPAERAEFGDNWEHVKRFAELMGRDPLLKAIPTPITFKMPWGTKGRDYTTRLLGLYTMHGTMITPEIFSHFYWRTQDWIKYGKPMPGDVPWWVRDMYIKPTAKKLKKIFTSQRLAYIAFFGLIGAAWGIIQGVHSAHEKKMEELGKPYQKWNEPIKEGYGPWIITESAYTTTIDGTAQVATVTGYSQYYPGSTEDLSPSEIAELVGLTITTTMAAAYGGMTTITALPTVMTPAAPEYAGILRLAPSTVNMPVMTTAAAKPRPTPNAAPLNHMSPDRLLLLGNPLPPANDPIQGEDARPLPPSLTSDTGSPFVPPTPRARPSRKAHGAWINGTYANGTATTPDAPDGDAFPSVMTSSADGAGRGWTLNHTGPSFSDAGPPAQNAPYNVAAVDPYGFANATSSFHGLGSSNGTYGGANGTRGSGNVTARPKGKVTRYLRGSAPWDGVVVPEISDVVPVGDGRWSCSWVPSVM